jgi:hypothetical protein
MRNNGFETWVTGKWQGATDMKKINRARAVLHHGASYREDWVVRPDFAC